jgi:putative addiction module component (TIGR02574 family)
MSIQEIESQALRLPARQRARLAQHLIASLDEDDETAEGWADEAARRAGAVADGTVGTISADDAIAEARRATS